MRDHDSAQSGVTIPPFAVDRYHLDDEEGSHDLLRVVCPRRTCGRAFWVETVWLSIEPVTGSTDEQGLPRLSWPYGRPCPYCSRASAIPEELRIKVSPSRRVVRRRRKQS